MHLLLVLQLALEVYLLLQFLLLEDLAHRRLETRAHVFCLGLDTPRFHLLLLRLLLQLESLFRVLFGDALYLLLKEAQLLVVGCIVQTGP